MKSIKKLVLEGFMLLASVVVLAGCKNDSVPEVTPAKLVSITVTPPTRTVYSVGESFDGSDMVVTATYEDGETREVTGWTTNFSDVTSEKGVNKKVTVSYTEGDNAETATFTVDVVDPSVPTKLTSYISPNHTDDTWTYMAFGEWPQTKANVEGISLQQVVGGRGYFKDNYYTDGNGNYYVKAAENANGSGDAYKYSDGTKAGQDGTSTQWFKVEPIIWRVLNAKDGKYNESENPLLLAENILTGGIKWAYSRNNYMESNIRKWLNGNSGSGAQSDYNGGAGFLQTAFTSEAQGLITPTTVDNSATSTLPNILTEEQKTTDWNNGKNDYACGDTTDKIFLLSEQEATMSDYGFAEYTAYGQGNTRIRVTTDYAKAAGAYQSGTTGYGGLWWLRSPHCSVEDDARDINDNGYAHYIDYVYLTNGGVVPALSISINGN